MVSYIFYFATEPVNNLKNNANDDKTEKVANDYQDTVNQLDNAQTAKENGNDSKMKEELNKVNSKLENKR
ncbi:hypothetical protein [Staphylococcus aureus]|uniref:hypothetical protein n=1 Tax=Staphylococcus aureus TaxID=1280 RepID=UPI000B2A5DEA|nr:hypothetical protein [Staphylococcus aureus]